ncbi:MAG: 1-(5-phosphoribosyl)-5-[(5-phosphoribosylamino)methylideneamino]imidazole-4-carboxamide isomerase [Chloroflexi bacterium]|nr:1-(5-phosphoribosyl)-5-[(5-phosphoribosylamino)methylideneamino]imidazole-4-carboxamide isomerase [Chloroflexota bacterium]MDA1239864.1 1-(5-phosphoribosyl)-5-[(5-phosphoribosylamino)methylideneamino]imidazole-4-carboxamide isomerase [Chloroflexota bacterium]
MEIIPAVDIRDGKCVRLAQGDYARETVFGDDPVAMARQWAEQGATRIHVVDLDGARSGVASNAAIVQSIARGVSVPVQTGGGIRSMDTVRSMLDAGLDRVVLGTAAVKDPAFLAEAIVHAADRLVVSVDAREGRVALEGWTEATDLDALAFVRQLEAQGVVRIVYTDILRDGVTDGPNVAMYERLARQTSVRIISAGGVTSVADLTRLSECGIEAAIVGRALYTGDVRLPEALQAVGA